jgi:UDP-N-acetylmuramoylalanine-D-glutamate ligase
MSWQGKTVLVLGLGESGLAMAQWLRARARACAWPIRAASRPSPPN